MRQLGTSLHVIKNTLLFYCHITQIKKAGDGMVCRGVVGYMLLFILCSLAGSAIQRPNTSHRGLFFLRKAWP